MERRYLKLRQEIFITKQGGEYILNSDRIFFFKTGNFRFFKYDSVEWE